MIILITVISRLNLILQMMESVSSRVSSLVKSCRHRYVHPARIGLLTCLRSVSVTFLLQRPILLFSQRERETEREGGETPKAIEKQIFWKKVHCIYLYDNKKAIHQTLCVHTNVS
jgi:hypothetical protein